MHEFLNNVFPDYANGQVFWRVFIRLAAAIALGGAIGFERQIEGKSAGVRTHMMVSLGAAVFALASLESSADSKELTKVIQGVAAGVGFLGAGAIIKVSSENVPKGLTTAGGIWMTAAIGLAMGAGLIWTALIGVCMAWLVLGVFHVVERWWHHRRKLRRLREELAEAQVSQPPP